MARNYSNIAFDTTLAAGIGAGDPTCTVVSAAGYPAAPFAIVLDPGLVTEEVCEVTIKAGAVFTITRGFDGTTAVGHALGAVVRHSAIAGDFTDLQTALLNVAYTNVANTFTLGPNRFNAGADGNVALAARRNSLTQTANIFEVQDQAGAALAYVNPVGGALLKGHSAIGANAAIDSPLPFSPGGTFSTALIAAEEMTISGAVQQTAFAAYLKVNPSGALSGTMFGAEIAVETTAGNVQAHGPLLAALNVRSIHRNAVAIPSVFGLSFFVSNQGGASVTTIVGANISPQNTGVGSTAATMIGLNVKLFNSVSAVTTDAIAIRVDAPTISSPPTNHYGIRIANITGGSALNYAIHTAGGEVRHLTGAAAVIGMVVQGFAAQSANLQEWRSSTSGIYGTISENGYFTTRKVAAPADAELSSSELAFWFDATNGAGKLMIKAKTADGTVVTGNVALI